ncbi:hypothetical protein [Riemerella columbipharyngis]|uniref:Uncharacterized protein n=1 Tax=Riemerella columbipharyngis TaxID=1071918 RepID=A0A1G7EYA5_9FLAO|nr:hypothetical protein [Riemerella columbipharyngis]SDE68622.1 hypothetical protein SAMN05421544_11821 [Riemerella columbipharyngis]
MKKKLTDNPNVPVFHWRKFIPETALNLVNINIDKMVSSENYQGCIFFKREKDSRVAQINIYKTVIEVRIYYVDGDIWYNIDWNDTTYLELTKNSGRTSVLEVCKILHEKGYQYSSVRF